MLENNQLDGIIAELDRKLGELNSEINALKLQHEEKIRTTLRPLFDEFFRQYPQVYALTWTQYTPYFNDGEECTFRVHDLYYVLDKHQEAFRDRPGEWESYGFTYGDPKLLEKQVALLKGAIEGTIDPSHGDEWRTWPLSRCFMGGSFSSWGGSSTRTFDHGQARKVLGELETDLADIREETAAYPNREEIKKAVNMMAQFIGSMGDDTARQIFGNHVQVIVTAEETDILEYEHD